MKESVIIYKPRLEDVYDWQGNQLLPESRAHVGVNNIVRLQFMDAESGYREAIYVKIVDVRDELLFGEVLDTYRISEECQQYVKDGEIVAFKRENIIEIPWDAYWLEENQNLQHLEHMMTNKSRAITGLLPRHEDN